MLLTLLLAVQAALPRPAITLSPAQPVQGSLFVVRARPPAGDTVASIVATFAGEPLHFERDTTGAFVAYAGVPVEARGTMDLSLAIERVDAPADSMKFPVTVASARFGRERLSVNPRFTDKPDSALAARIAREAESIRLAWQQTHRTPRLWSGPFLRPRPSRITSPFGTGREFNGVVQSRHLGLDFDGNVGATIRASNAGVVSLVGDYYYSGSIVIVNHGAGFATAYLHMSKTLVAVGDTVTRGQLIGLVGSSGRVTGPHLHWIAKYGALSLSPLTLISATAEPKKPAPAAPARRRAVPRS